MSAGPAGLSLWPHQAAELEFVRTHPHALILSDVGTGKTLPLLMFAAERVAAGDKVLWVTSKSLISQLQSEAKKWLPDGPHPAEYRNKPVASDFACITYGKVGQRWEELRAQGWSVLIADESHALKGGGVNADGFARLARRAKRVILATGSPNAGVTELDALGIMRSGRFPDTPSVKAFARNVRVDNYGRPWGLSPAAGRAVHQHVRRYAIRHTGTATEVPHVERHLHVVQPSGPAPTPARGRGNRGSRGFQAVRRATRDADALVPEVCRLLDTVYADHRKAVVFTENHDLLQPLAAALGAQRGSCCVLEGSMTVAQRADAVEQHKRSDGPRVLLGTAALEQGLNLQHASLLVTVVETYSPARTRQREGRICRPGSDHADVVSAVVQVDHWHEVRKAHRSQVKDTTAASLLDCAPTGAEIARLVAEAERPVCEHGPRVPVAGIGKRTGLPFQRWDCPQAGACPVEWHGDAATWEALACGS